MNGWYFTGSFFVKQSLNFYYPMFLFKGFFPDEGISSASEICINEYSDYFVCGCKNGFEYISKDLACQGFVFLLG